jgi:hypothetical protein
MQHGLMLRRIFFHTFLFSATASATVHLTSTVDLTALRPSGGPRPSGRPGASNALHTNKVIPRVLLRDLRDFF